MSDFTELVDLAAKRLGGMVLAANDEFFAPKENLLEPAAPTFDPAAYSDRGKVMDGWETRRRREPGHDWCLVRLGLPGIVRGVVVDTSFFRGNYPQSCSLEGCAVEDPTAVADLDDGSVEWIQLLPRSALRGDSQNPFPVDVPRRVTHLRFGIHPDGGVARLRVHGEPLPDLRSAAGPLGHLDLAAVVNGGVITACSEEFFSSRHNLISIGDSRDMGDGWETSRRRGPGHDWVVVRLAAGGRIERVEVDTTNFKGNHPESCSLDVCAVGAPSPPADITWSPLLPPARLGPHARHVFDVAPSVAATHARFNIFPDGGVARLRLFGRVDDDGWRQAGVRWLDAQTDARCAAELRTCCASRAWAERMVAARPFGTYHGLTAAADVVWSSLGDDDWREAFAAHPRIGDSAPIRERGSDWSRQEQARAGDASPATLAALADGNRSYEERFGHVFLICATGKSAEEMLAALRDRLGNDPDTELGVAAEEQRKITRLRLDKLMRPQGQRDQLLEQHQR